MKKVRAIDITRDLCVPQCETSTDLQRNVILAFFCAGLSTTAVAASCGIPKAEVEDVIRQALRGEPKAKKRRKK